MLDPESPVARNELEYLQQLRDGAPDAPVQTVASRKLTPMECDVCTSRAMDGGRAIEVNGRIVYLCKTCVRRREKKWWQFWK